MPKPPVDTLDEFDDPLRPSDILRARRRAEPLVQKQVLIEVYQLDWLLEKAVANKVSFNMLLRAFLDVAIDDYEIGVAGVDGKSGKSAKNAKNAKNAS